MNDSMLKNQLLKQNGAGPVEAELNVLRKLGQDEQRRARKLVRWTFIVWGVWLVMIAIMILVPMLAWRSQASPHKGVTPPTTVPALVPATSPGVSSSGAPTTLSVMMLPVALLLIICLPGLPIAGIILLVLSFLAHRSASASQIRASLASIDAQLRILSAGQKPPGNSAG